jgi:alkyldihydroxyacetonephosphate synthase
VRPAPAQRRYDGFVFPSFAEGREAFRRCAQAHAAPDVARLSDEDETRMTLALAGSGAKQRALAAYLRLRGLRTPCLCIAGWEGEPADVRRRREQTLSLLRRGGGVPLGSAPGRAWEHGRYEGPYLRDDLLDRGVIAETLETAHVWSRLDDLYRAVRGALSAHATLVACHVSHLYEAGASLYFTFLMPAQPGREREQWRAAKAAASEAIVAAGGTITHHHAIGRDHATWLRHEAGDLGLDALRAVKERLYPAGVMNPGKLITG